MVYKGIRYSKLRPWVTNTLLAVAVALTGIVPLLIAWRKK